MPRTDLPSGSWVEYRDRLMAEDKIAVQSAIKVIYKPDPENPKREIRVADGGTDEKMRVALLSRIITAWSFPGVPVPAQNIADPQELIGATLDLDDYEALCEATDPLFRRAAGLPKLPEGPPSAPAETATEPAAAEIPQES